MHSRFNREVYLFKKDFTSALAKCLVSQSPYTVPDNLSECIIKFEKQVEDAFAFDSIGMVKISLIGLTSVINTLLENVPEIMELNRPKNGGTKSLFVSAYREETHPDNDFIDIMAVAQNIVVEFAEREDAQAYLDENPELIPVKDNGYILPEEFRERVFEFSQTPLIKPAEYNLTQRILEQADISVIPGLLKKEPIPDIKNLFAKIKYTEHEYKTFIQKLSSM